MAFPLASQLPAAFSTFNPTLGLQPISWWETRYLGAWSNNTATARALFATGDSWDHYNGAYYIDANVAMYRASGNLQYLDRALEYANTVMDAAAISSSLGSQAWGDSFWGWTSYKNTQTGQEVPLYESYCWRYITRLLRTIKETPSVYATPAYRTQYDALLAFAEQHVFTKWYTRGANSYIYRSRTHMASHWGAICYDLSLIAVSYTVRSQCGTVVSNINTNLPNSTSSMRQQFVNAGAGYFWSDVWASWAHPGQDVSHGNAVMTMMVEQHADAVEWTDADMARMVYTLNSIIWPTASSYKLYVDGTGVGNGWFNDGFIKLARYSNPLQKRLETHNVGQGTQFFGNCALNVRLMQLGSHL